MRDVRGRLHRPPERLIELDALVPAFVAALLAGIGDRPAAYAALLGDRYSRTALLWCGVVGGHAAALAIAAIGGALVAPLLSPNAKALVLALSLVFAGGAALFPSRLPRWLGRFEIGPLGAAAVGTGGLALGDRTAFIVFALAARGTTPALAAIGALAAGLALAGAAMTLGALGWSRLPLRMASALAGVLLLAVGVIVGLGALRLI